MHFNDRYIMEAGLKERYNDYKFQKQFNNYADHTRLKDHADLYKKHMDQAEHHHLMSELLYDEDGHRTTGNAHMLAAGAHSLATRLYKKRGNRDLFDEVSSNAHSLSGVANRLTEYMNVVDNGDDEDGTEGELI